MIGFSKKLLLFLLLFSLGLFAVLVYILQFFPSESTRSTVEHNITDKLQITVAGRESNVAIAVQQPLDNVSSSSQVRYLSYQPPGNGWNNQRIALEGATLLAALLKRTLIVHPLSSHRSGIEIKNSFAPEEKFGHVAYNQMQQLNLLPLSLFLDLHLLSQAVPVIEFNRTHSEFIMDYSHLRWHRVCHSMGFGYWVNRRPATENEKEFLESQTFSQTPFWRRKCPIEIEEAKHSKKAMVKFISDFVQDDSDILYIEEGTLFGVQFRFMTIGETLAAQDLIINHIKYKRTVYEKASIVKEKLGSYNAIHVRRVAHIGSTISQKDWLVKMKGQDFLIDTPIYIATDEPNLSWFSPITAAGFRLYFAKDFRELLNFTFLHESVRQDVLGIHEQVICELADKFIPTEHSTFSVFVRRLRKEVSSRDGLYLEGMHSFWVGHMIE